MSRLRHSILVGAGLAAFAAMTFLPAAAGASHLAGLEFRLQNPDNHASLGTLQPGDTLTVGVGERVRLHAVIPQGGKDLFPRVSYSVQGGHNNIDIDALGRENEGGALIVEGTRAVDIQPGTSAIIRYHLVTEQQKAAGEASGTIRIHVTQHPRFGLGAAPTAMPSFNSAAEERAFRIIEALYQGALLRAPEDAQTSRVQAIVRDGWPAIEGIARQIAASEESQIAVYDRGVSNQQRLLALYRHLLGLEQGQIPLDEWNHLLRRLDERRFEDVVVELVRRPEFASRFGIAR